MTLREWFNVGFSLFKKLKLTKRNNRLLVAQEIQQSTKSHPAVDMPEIEGNFLTILDVYEQLDKEI